MKTILTISTFLIALVNYAQNLSIEGKIRINTESIDRNFKIIILQENHIIDSFDTKEPGHYIAQIKKGAYSFKFHTEGYMPITVMGLNFQNNSKNMNFNLMMKRIPLIKSVLPKTIPKHLKDSSSKLDSISIPEMTEYLILTGKLKTKTKVNSVNKNAGKDLAVYDMPTTEFVIGSKRDKVHSLVTPPFMHRSGETSLMDIESMPSSGSSSSETEMALNTSIHAGQVTAGHWRDLDNWEAWNKTNENAINNYMKQWGFYPNLLSKVILVDEKGQAARNISVTLQTSEGKSLWSSVSDANGFVYLWPNLFTTGEELKNLVLLLSDGKYTLKLKKAEQYINSDKYAVVNFEVKTSQRIEIGIMVDATGSMADEIRFLQVELIDVIGRIKRERPCSDIYTGSVFYRDFGDKYVTKFSPLSDNAFNTIDFIGEQSAQGGGDFPEAVEEGLETSIDQLGWSTEQCTKILFILLDAPPHSNVEAHKAKIRKSIEKAAKMGIRIIPISASGIDKSTEFLLKYFAIATNGEYIYITNDSKIGNFHIQPTGGESDVEFLNDLMVNIILNYSAITCPNQPNQNPADTSKQLVLTEAQIDSLKQQNQNQEIFANENWSMRFYPNPANEFLFIEFSESAEKIWITTMNGQTIYNSQSPGQTSINMNIRDWNSGMYLVYAIKNGETISGKLLVLH
ncbi:MAG: T9SS type A sorting domain-containing protein [Bacteroidia bacterium]|nr:T9SS type A sorting domain-containing protein [Bacteroidia bacterium]